MAKPSIKVRQFVLDTSSLLYFEQDVAGVLTSSGVTSAGSYPYLGPTGQLDPSVIPGGGGSSSFSAVTTGTNTNQVLTVGNSSIFSYSGTGVINANQIGTINVSGNLPVHEGQLLISQPGNTEAVWADPFVQGVYVPGTNVTAVGSPAVPINPVLIGAQDPTNLLQNLHVDASGNLLTSLKVSESDVTQQDILMQILAEVRAMRRMFAIFAEETGQARASDFDPQNTAEATPEIGLQN